MRLIRCPNCQEPLPWTANYCTICGATLSLSSFEQSSATQKQTQGNPTNTKANPPERPAAFRSPRLYSFRTHEHENEPTQPLEIDEDVPTLSIATDENEETQRINPSKKLVTVTPGQWQLLAHGAGSQASTAPTEAIDDQLAEDDESEMQRRRTWNKVVTYKTSRIPPATPERPQGISPTGPSTATIPSPRPLAPLPPAPPMRPVPPVSPEAPRRLPPGLFFWISMLAIVGLLLGGVFGVVITLGRGNSPQPSPNQNAFSLQVTPSSVALGGILTLRGSNFSPRGRVGLTRDTNIPINDTGGAHIISADNHGSFTDTVIVDPTWLAGPHIMRAEDARMHKTASFTVMVTGHSPSLRPPHLLLSSTSIDLGSGDQATNSTRAITLTDAGGGQISWQGAVTQPWLLLSPQSGTFASGQNVQVMIAGDRSSLKQGAYSGDVIFASNTGKITLAVKMNVIPLQPEHEAVLQLTPPVLSFTATDGSTNPLAQVVTVSNPGVQPLQWGASSSTSDGSNWLSLSAQSGTIPKGGSQAVKLSVNISSLLPGTYNGSLTFFNQGAEPIKDSPQTVYVSLTVLPQCAIQVSPWALTFTGVYLQPSPDPKIISVGGTQGCSAPLYWSTSVNANNGGHWLSISPSSGTTPTYPSVSVSISDLIPGTYTGSIIFTSSAGTQTLPVTFILGQPTTPILITAPAVMTFNGVIGQPDPPSQIATVSNTGGGTLAWNATAATSIGGAWLSVAPAAGNLSSHQSRGITVTVTLLQNLIPGTYTGAVTISGTDSSSHPAVGSPQTIPVTFIVQAACTIASAPLALNFVGVAGQPDPATQEVNITASGACTHTLDWTATATTTPVGGAWLTATPATGTVNLSTSSATNIGVSLAGLPPAPFEGNVTITAIDSVTKQQVGTPQTIDVTLTVKPPCTLQIPSVPSETFSAEAGSNPTTQSFSIGVTGTCTGPVTITPTATTGNGGNWLSIAPASATVSSGQSATFTVTVTSATLSAGSYTGSISLVAVDGGLTTAGSPRNVGVTLTVIAPPALTTGPGPLTFNLNTGTSYQQISIGNAGGEPLNWTAALDPGAPSFVSLSATSGTGLAGGTNVTINVVVDASGLQGGSTYSTSATISAIDPITGNTVSGSPSQVPITINIAPPAMQLNTTTLAFTTSAGVNPQPQTITITNTGGNTLTWTAGTPSVTWLTVTPASGSDNAGQSSTLTFNVDVTGLAPGNYPATVNITPTPGTVVTVNISLTIN